MADRPVSPVKHEESATTREEMDFDDNEHEQDTGRVSPIGQEAAALPSSARKSVSFQEAEEQAPPAKPPRPLSPQQQAEHTLIEAFPSIDTKVVKAVLMASGGKVEPAFNALLGMSDPSFSPEADAVPPPQPPRPTQRLPQTQVEADEMYARQLAEQYNGMPRAQNHYNQREPARRGPNQQQRPQYQDEQSPERNFFDDDLPEIGKNIQQGFFDTQKKVNSWISTFKKKIDGDEGEDEDDLYSQGSSKPNTNKYQGRQNFGSSQSEQLAGIRKQAESRQQQTRSSTEANRYDADPHELGEDEFERLELHDSEAPPPIQPPRTSSRQKPNPDLFKPQPKPPQSGPVDEVDAYDRNAASDKDASKKWQPLTSVQPHPEEDNDPFSISDDEEDDKADTRKEDSDRLKAAARQSVSEGAGGETGRVLEESATTGSLGTKNKEAEELMSGKKE